MGVRELILSTLRHKTRIKVADVVGKTGFSRAYVHRFFRQLADEGRIIRLGKANETHYVLADKKTKERIRKSQLTVHRILRNQNLSEDLVLKEVKASTGIFIRVRKHVERILDYAFTEMLNNAIEHSDSPTIDFTIARTIADVRFDVKDKGVGIWNNIMRKKHLSDHLEAIQDLLKGKQTTAPALHSGEGIFFTSKLADRFVIRSSQKKLVFDNINTDVYLSDIKTVKGTRVSFSVSLDSKRRLMGLFDKYTDDSMEFSKTGVQIKFYKEGVEYVSRSQARRVLTGLEKFKTIELDFKNVDTIGQAFADEIFRVWHGQHPDVKITTKNAAENVMFMVNRAKPERTQT